MALYSVFWQRRNGAVSITSEASLSTSSGRIDPQASLLLVFTIAINWKVARASRMRNNQFAVGIGCRRSQAAPHQMRALQQQQPTSHQRHQQQAQTNISPPHQHIYWFPFFLINRHCDISCVLTMTTYRQLSWHWIVLSRNKQLMRWGAIDDWVERCAQA